MTKDQVTGIVLAGGQGSRMGSKDKGWLRFHGEPMIKQVIQRLAPQVANIIISANRHLVEYQQLGYPIVQDDNAHGDRFQGPIAGILSGLQKTTTEYAVIVPCDAPLISTDLVEQLLRANRDQTHNLTLFRVAGRTQPLFGLYRRSLLADLEEYFQSGERKLMAWCESQQPEVIDFRGDTNAFANINTPDELQRMESGHKSP